MGSNMHFLLCWWSADLAKEKKKTAREERPKVARYLYMSARYCLVAWLTGLGEKSQLRTTRAGMADAAPQWQRPQNVSPV